MLRPLPTLKKYLSATKAPAAALLLAATALSASVAAAEAPPPGEPSGPVQLAAVRVSQCHGRMCQYDEYRFHIVVQNLAYEKEVVAHARRSGRVFDVPAHYVASLANNRELWEGTLKITDAPGCREGLEVRVSYRVLGTDNWSTYGQEGARVDDCQIYSAQPVIVSRLPGPHDGYGQITIKNLGQHQSVTVVYTTDGWASVKQVVASRSIEAGTNGIEVWTFTFAPEEVALARLEYAVAYESGSHTYWDNNFGRNYVIVNP